MPTPRGLRFLLNRDDLYRTSWQHRPTLRSRSGDKRKSWFNLRAFNCANGANGDYRRYIFRTSARVITNTVQRRERKIKPVSDTSGSALPHWQRASGMHDRRHSNDIGVNVEHSYLRQSLDHQLTRARIGLILPGALRERLQGHDVLVDAPVDMPGVEYIAAIFRYRRSISASQVEPDWWCRL